MKRKGKRMLYLALAGVLAFAPLGCVMEQRQLEKVDKEIAALVEQERGLKEQAAVTSLTSSERNAINSNIERTHAMVEELKAEREKLADRVEEGLNDWVAVGSQVILGVLGLGALGGRRPQ